MIAPRILVLAGLAAGVAAFIATPAAAQEAHPNKIKAAATISILGDLVRNVGGDRLEVTTLVGPNGDAHVYSPTPGDAKKLAAANIVFVNGLGLEGWMTRLVTASGAKAPSSPRESRRAGWRTKTSPDAR
jgi:zinc/manganese transport system substrate-binding protein